MKILIVYKASGLSDNPFVRLLAEGIRDCGFEVVCSVDDFWHNAAAYDLIHLQWPEELFGWRYLPTSEQVAALRSRFEELHKQGIPIVYTRHNSRPHKGNGPLAEAYRVVEEQADAIVHMGDYSRREFLARYPQSQQVQAVIPHHIYEQPTDSAFTREEARHRLGIPDKKCILLAFGAFRHTSERRLTWRAFRQLHKPGKFLLAPRLWPHTRFGSRRHGIRGWATQLLYHAAHAFERLFSCRITAPDRLLSESDLLACFTAADVVFIQRTDILNSGNVPQAFAFGRVVAGPDSGNIGELLAATGNPVFDPSNPASVNHALAKAVRLAAEGYGDKNREYALQHLRLPQIAAAYGAVYTQLYDTTRR